MFKKDKIVEDSAIIKKISEALVLLEKQDEIVITSTNIRSISRTIFHASLESWFEEANLAEEPIECSISHLLEQTVIEVTNRFSVQENHAKEIVNAYYKEWIKSRSQKEIAEIFWHETPQEMSKRAYYHIELGKEDNRDLEYLDWRKKY